MKIYQVDAFAEKMFQGNPAAIVPLKNWLPDDLMQRIAMENNLAETAFTVPVKTRYAIRWFTPTVEVELCGHATLAAGHVFFEHEGFDGNEIIFESMKRGLLKVIRGENGTNILDFPSIIPEKADALPVLFEALHLPPSTLWKGPFDYLVKLDSQAQLEALQPDFSLLATTPGRGVIVTAKGEDCDFVSRCFFPQSGIDEDPVTGSAHSMLIPFWAGLTGKTKMKAVQLSKRKGFLDCELSGDRVLIGGKAITYLVGNISV